MFGDACVAHVAKGRGASAAGGMMEVAKVGKQARRKRTVQVGLICAVLCCWNSGSAQAPAPETKTGTARAASSAPPTAPTPQRPASTTAGAAPLATPALVAKPKSDKAKEADLRKQSLTAAQNQLASADADVIQAGFVELGKLGGREAVDILLARLHRGLPPQLIDGAVDALVKLKDVRAVPALLELATHRRFQVREHAVTALGALGAKNAQSVLLYALDDPSPEVREAAARSLGKVGDARAIAALTTASERGVQAALIGLASLGSNKEIELVLARAKAGAWQPAQPALLALLSRKNLPQATKLRVITALRDVKSAESQACLVALFNELGKDGDARIRGALSEASGAASPAPKGVAVMANQGEP
jgi:HEAT repeat protein